MSILQATFTTLDHLFSFLSKNNCAYLIKTADKIDDRTVEVKINKSVIRFVLDRQTRELKSLHINQGDEGMRVSSKIFTKFIESYPYNEPHSLLGVECVLTIVRQICKGEVDNLYKLLILERLETDITITDLPNRD